MPRPLADHVHVGLEYYAGSVLMTGSGGDKHRHVADGVGLGLDAVLLSKVKEPLPYLALLLRGTRNLSDFVENAEHFGGF